MEELGIPGLGGESGNAEALATTVLEQCGGGKVLFLRGDQAKDTVVEVLTGGGVEVDQVVVYESLANPGLEALLTSLPLPTWVVLFSPSGARLSLPLLEARHGGQALAAARLVAIGPSTSTCVQHLGHLVHGVAAAPSPQGLLGVLRPG